MKPFMSVLIPSISIALFSNMAFASSVPVIPLQPYAQGTKNFTFTRVTAVNLNGSPDPAHSAQCEQQYTKILPSMNLMVNYDIQGIAHEDVQASILNLPMLQLNAEGIGISTLGFMSDIQANSFGSVQRISFEIRGQGYWAGVLLKGGRNYNCALQSI